MSTAPSHTHPADRDINAALNEAAQCWISSTRRKTNSATRSAAGCRPTWRIILPTTLTAAFSITVNPLPKPPISLSPTGMAKARFCADIMGREYIDMLGGFGLYSPGIRHPKIVEAVKAQLDRSPQYSQEMLDPLRGQLAKVIAKLTPGELQYGFFANSGTEAVDGAMKLAKLYTGRRGFISTTGGFHGKSLGALSLLGKFVYREPLLPLLGGVRHVPYGDADAVEQLLRIADSVGSMDVAAVVVEPIQGEAGADCAAR